MALSGGIGAVPSVLGAARAMPVAATVAAAGLAAGSVLAYHTEKKNAAVNAFLEKTLAASLLILS